ncbi:MAG: DUF1549 domain-containing protein [Bryobacteraceae bacterium]
MPPGKTSLSPAEIAVLREWITAGAKWDATSKPAGSDASWWSFRKVVRPQVPAVKNASVAKNPIDNFILAKLEQKGLQPAPAAGRGTLVRRAYFDLHGLPPTPEQVDQFIKDEAPDAYEKLIDRLLASPRYGERWGRYWLDLVRYADTSGFETDHFFTTAWRYRDYVVSSYNSDKPYTTFVQEQIAADEIWPMNMDLEGTSTTPKAKVENVNPSHWDQPVHHWIVRSSSLTTVISFALSGKPTPSIQLGLRFSDSRLVALAATIINSIPSAVITTVCRRSSPEAWNARFHWWASSISRQTLEALRCWQPRRHSNRWPAAVLDKGVLARRPTRRSRRPMATSLSRLDPAEL